MAGGWSWNVWRCLSFIAVPWGMMIPTSFCSEGSAWAGFPWFLLVQTGFLFLGYPGLLGADSTKHDINPFIGCFQAQKFDPYPYHLSDLSSGQITSKMRGLRLKWLWNYHFIYVIECCLLLNTNLTIKKTYIILYNYQLSMLESLF